MILDHESVFVFKILKPFGNLDWHTLNCYIPLRRFELTGGILAYDP
jgi:hypothetical protein